MKVIHATKYTGRYKSDWAGYYFKEDLDYTSGRHTGVDYNWGWGDQDLGQPTYAIADGVVVYVGDQTRKGFGKTIIIRHTMSEDFAKWSKGKKYAYSRYMHLDRFEVKTNQKVKCGQTIGRVGKTGTRYAHLHVDLWTDKNGLGSHLDYHKDTQLDSYLDPFATAEKWKNFKTVSEADKYKKLYQDALNKLKQANESLAQATKQVKELSTRPTRAELDAVIKQLEKAKTDLKEQEDDSVTRSDWANLWNKILRFVKGE